MKRGMSIIWRIRCDGSKLSPTVPSQFSRIRRHIRGVVARLWPPGHSSYEKSIGQFSKVSRRPWSAANRTISGQIRSASSQFWSWVFAASAPMNVLTMGTSIFSAAVITCLRWPMTVSRWAGSGWSGFG
jgi:hypothetical protein